MGGFLQVETLCVALDVPTIVLDDQWLTLVILVAAWRQQLHVQVLCPRPSIFIIRSAVFPCDPSRPDCDIASRPSLSFSRLRYLATTPETIMPSSGSPSATDAPPPKKR